MSKAKGALADTIDSDADYSDEDYDDEYGSGCDSEYASDDGELRSCNRKEKDDISPALTNDQLLLCGATLKGYSLKNKKWCKLTCLNRSSDAF